MENKGTSSKNQAQKIKQEAAAGDGSMDEEVIDLLGEGEGEAEEGNNEAVDSDATEDMAMSGEEEEEGL